MKHFERTLFLFCCLGSFLNLPILGQEPAIIPYRHLIKIAQGDRKDNTAKSYKLKISSTLEDVSPEEIQLILRTSEGPTYIIVDKEGVFEIPNSTMLYEENPMMVANQPRGTLKIAFKMEVPPFKPPTIKDGKISYQELFKPVMEMKEYVKNIDPTFGGVGKNQFALEIRTETPIKITREIVKNGQKVTGARTFRPFKGVILLILEDHMFKENPTVDIPGKVKMNLIPVSAEQAERIKSSW